MAGIPSARRGEFLLTIVATMAASDTPWIVCEECSMMLSFERAQAREAARTWRSTGRPAGGFALCELQVRGGDHCIKNIDNDSMLAAVRAATTAFTAVKTTLILEKSEGHQIPQRPLVAKKKRWQFWK